MNNPRINEIRPTDYILGSNSPIKLKSVISDGNWTSHVNFFELQKIGNFETDGCEFFTAQESFDAQMDALIPSLPQSVWSDIVNMGFLDKGSDGLMHFHSSPRFLQVCSGVGQKGASMPQVWDAMRSFGCLPWKDLPYDGTMTATDYFAPIPNNLLQKAQQFLSLLGGKQAIQYYWIIQNAVRNDTLMQQALLTAPLCLGIAVSDGWNQVSPTDPPAAQTPQHAVMEYAQVGSSLSILDHYIPYEKVLDASYPVHFCLQGIVNPVFQVAQEVTQVVNQAEKIIPQIPSAQQNQIIAAIKNLLTQFLQWMTQ